MAERRRKPKYIIGLDFGNSFSFPCYIPELDLAVGRLGGTPRDLLPADMHYGYHSVFFYSKKAADRCRGRLVAPPPWCGEDAVKARATPVSNRIRNLKRHLNQPLKLDDWEGSYDDAIVQLIQYLMRRANEVLETDTLTTSNLLSLSYPATFTRAKCSHLKSLAERATLSDGTHIQVVGMIAEPAAAALDYLVENGREKQETTVMTYDLGGGTFDLAIVSAYPQGRKNVNGQLYYYDIESTGGIEDLGGTEFDEVMYRLLQAKVPKGEKVPEDSLRRLAETLKVDLSRDMESEAEMYSITGEAITLTVTREEFERKALPLIQRTIQETQRTLRESRGKEPELIVLTGGASQMPAIQRELERAFPQFQGKIVMYRPSKAIAYGAARYGTEEDRSDPVVENVVQQRMPRDIGIRFYIRDTEEQYIDTCIHAGTPLPYSSDFERSATHFDDQKTSYFAVFEAKVEHPDNRQIERDYTEIMGVTLEHGGPVPKGTVSESRLVLNKDGLLKVEARDPSKPDKPPVHNECTLKNLS